MSVTRPKPSVFHAIELLEEYYRLEDDCGKCGARDNDRDVGIDALLGTALEPVCDLILYYEDRRDYDVCARVCRALLLTHGRVVTDLLGGGPA
jgi:hypothetical protein